MWKLIAFLFLLVGIAVLFCMPFTSDFLDQSPGAMLPQGKPSSKSNSAEMNQK